MQLPRNYLRSTYNLVTCKSLICEEANSYMTKWHNVRRLAGAGGLNVSSTSDTECLVL